MIEGNSPSMQSFCSDPVVQEAFARYVAINSANGEENQCEESKYIAC